MSRSAFLFVRIFFEQPFIKIAEPFLFCGIPVQLIDRLNNFFKIFRLVDIGTIFARGKIMSFAEFFNGIADSLFVRNEGTTDSITANKRDNIRSAFFFCQLRNSGIEPRSIKTVCIKCHAHTAQTCKGKIGRTSTDYVKRFNFIAVRFYILRKTFQIVFRFLSFSIAPCYFTHFIRLVAYR